MLTEHCVISLLGSQGRTSDVAAKDPAILVHEFQPGSTVTSTFKKGSVNVNCLAVSSTHVFAADNAVIHVYNLEKGNQEATVPFLEAISSLALVGSPDAPATLAIGMKSGRLTLWELCTGQLVFTPPSHLDSVKCLAVDSTSNYLVSGSDDSNIYVWSIPALLSFSASSHVDPRSPTHAPLRTFSDHRSAVLAVTISSGYMSTSVAVSSSQDNLCIIWDYRTGDSLRIFLLSSPASNLVLDPANRAIYAGHDDGSIQMINLLSSENEAESGMNSVQSSQTALQPSSKDRWQDKMVSGQPLLSLGLSYDGTLLLSGHQDGKVHMWDVARGRYGRCLSTQSAPVTNIIVPAPLGFLKENREATKSVTIVKPRVPYEGTSGRSGMSVPSSYSFMGQFISEFNISRFSSESGEDELMVDFDAALVHSILPMEYLEQGLATFSGRAEAHLLGQSSADSGTNKELSEVKEQLEASRKLNKYALGHVDKLNNELRWFKERDKAKERAKNARRMRKAKVAEAMRKKAMGEAVDEDAMSDGEGEQEDDFVEEASSTTDEIGGDE